MATRLVTVTTSGPDALSAKGTAHVADVPFAKVISVSAVGLSFLGWCPKASVCDHGDGSTDVLIGDAWAGQAQVLLSYQI